MSDRRGRVIIEIWGKVSVIVRNFRRNYCNLHIKENIERFDQNKNLFDFELLEYFYKVQIIPTEPRNKCT